MAQKYKVTLIRSLNGRTETQRKTARALGLARINQSVVKEKTPEIQGQIQKLAHLLRVEVIES